MMKRFSVWALISAIMFSITFFPFDTASAQIADGTYQINYEMKEANNNNTSIADGYFSKPATLTVNGGTKTVQFTVKSADMVQSLSIPGSSINVVSDNGNTRTYSFTASDLSKPVTMNMHIIVPDLPELPGGYDREHTARAVFNLGGLPSAGDNTNSEDNNEASTTGENTEKVVKNPKTGDESQVMLYVFLLIGAIGVFFVVRKLRPTGN